MKKNYNLMTLLTLMLFAFLSLQSNAQVRLKNVNPATGAVTLHNYGGSTVNVGTYWLCNYPSYNQLSSLTVTQGSLNLAANAEVTVTSTIGLSVSDSELGLYNSSAFPSSTAMQDYVQWGASGHEREVVAVNKGIWTAGTFVSDTPPLEYTGNGSQNGASFWQAALSVEEFEHSKSFKIVQNPAENILEIEFQQNSNQAEVKIYSLLGKLVLHQNIDSELHVKVDVSSLSKGMYLVNISNNGSTSTLRFIKK